MEYVTHNAKNVCEKSGLAGLGYQYKKDIFDGETCTYTPPRVSGPRVSGVNITQYNTCTYEWDKHKGPCTHEKKLTTMGAMLARRPNARGDRWVEHPKVCTKHAGGYKESLSNRINLFLTIKCEDHMPKIGNKMVDFGKMVENNIFKPIESVFKN